MLNELVPKDPLSFYLIPWNSERTQYIVRVRFTYPYLWFIFIFIVRKFIKSTIWVKRCFQLSMYLILYILTKLRLCTVE